MSVVEAYAKGTVSFMGVELNVGPGALVPRAETELLGLTTATTIEAMGLTAPRVVDVCCGVGNLVCGVAMRFPALRGWASDVSAACVKLAQENVARLGLGERVRIAQGDLFVGLAGEGLESRVDVIVCNPPYISQKRLEGECAPLLEHEPREAFDGGPYGLTIHQRVMREGLAFLRPGGTLLFEIGQGQADQVRILFNRARVYEPAQFVVDAGGNPRVVHARRRAD